MGRTAGAHQNAAGHQEAAQPVQPGESRAPRVVYWDQSQLFLEEHHPQNREAGRRSSIPQLQQECRSIVSLT